MTDIQHKNIIPIFSSIDSGIISRIRSLLESYAIHTEVVEKKDILVLTYEIQVEKHKKELSLALLASEHFIELDEKPEFIIAFDRKFRILLYNENLPINNLDNYVDAALFDFLEDYETHSGHYFFYMTDYPEISLGLCENSYFKEYNFSKYFDRDVFTLFSKVTQSI